MVAVTLLVLKSAGRVTQPVQLIAGSAPRASSAKTWMLSNGLWVTEYSV